MYRQFRFPTKTGSATLGNKLSCFHNRKPRSCQATTSQIYLFGLFRRTQKEEYPIENAMDLISTSSYKLTHIFSKNNTFRELYANEKQSRQDFPVMMKIVYTEYEGILWQKEKRYCFSTILLNIFGTKSVHKICTIGDDSVLMEEVLGNPLKKVSRSKIVQFDPIDK